MAAKRKASAKQLANQARFKAMIAAKNKGKTAAKKTMKKGK
jgi:hypothetical protein